MSVTYVWEFSTFDTAPSSNGLLDVVKTIHWRLNAEEDGYRSSVYGTAPLSDPNPDNFIAYKDITKQWASDATSSVIDVPAYEATLAADIARQKNPPIVSAAPPFQN
jgi:hypothetical protein